MRSDVIVMGTAEIRADCPHVTLAKRVARAVL